MSTAIADDETEEEEIVLSKRKPVDEEMDITPMIDITFLLLIFFVVCSTMDPSKSGKIPKAKNGSAVSADESAVIFIEPLNKDAVVVKRFDGREFSRDEDAQVSEIVEYVTEEMEQTLGRPKTNVLIFADQDIPVNHVFRVQRIIGDAFTELEVTYVAIKEE
jgi:biopolymer transport protein ExbD